MLLQATGTVDASGQPTQFTRDGAAQFSMSIAGIIKKYKRTLTNFQEDFLVPLIRKAAWRFMQFDPERYPAADFKFIPMATLGIIAREYEQQQLIALLQTLGPDTPVLPMILKGIIASSSLPNRADMIQQLDAMMQPSPEQQQMQQAQMQLQTAAAQAEIAKLQSEATRNNASAQKDVVEAQLMPQETQAKIISGLSQNIRGQDSSGEFAQRAKIAELALKEEAEKYVDFTRALKDEKISDAEIEELMGKWGMTRAEVIAYAKTVQDGTALQKALSKSWATPGDEAAEAWKRALAALNAYLAALNTGKPQGITPITPNTPITPVTPTPSGIIGAGSPAYASVSALQEHIGDLTTMRADVGGATALGIKLKEQIDEYTDQIKFGSEALGTIVDEQSKAAMMQSLMPGTITAESGFDPASFRMGENAGLTINMTVQGNVQTEADLANAIRQRILSEQASGKPIVFVGGL